MVSTDAFAGSDSPRSWPKLWDERRGRLVTFREARA
jgi:hypothetical protein